MILPPHFYFKIQAIQIKKFMLYLVPDPCKTDGCSAPYNVGCRVVGNKAQCVCPSCPNVRSPVCASDDVQDLSECHMKRQACEMDIAVTVDKRAPCGTFYTRLGMSPRSSLLGEEQIPYSREQRKWSLV